MNKHLIVSLIKSVLRLTGLVILFWDIKIGITIIIVAELLGILEEL